MDVRLTPQERRIAEQIAWGAAQKEVADNLHISVRTVVNHLQNIYTKAGIGHKPNELSAWWFCTNFNISFELSPFARATIAAMLLFIAVPHEIFTSDETLWRPRSRRAANCSRWREGDDIMNLLDFNT